MIDVRTFQSVMAWQSLLLFALLASASADWDAPREADLEVQLSMCGNQAIKELVEVVRSLLPLKELVAESQRQIQEMHNVTEETRKFLSRIKSDDVAMTALRDETVLLRREISTLKAQKEVAVTAARMQGRASRAELSGRCDEEMSALQLECVSKIMQLGTEAQENLHSLRDENRNLTERLAVSEQQCNSSMEAALEEVRNQNEDLRIRLEACPDVEELKKKPRQPKLSPGKNPKTDTSVSKMPPSMYKHSCKGFTDASPPVDPSPYETSVRIGNRQYLIGKEKVTWGEAWRMCKARGMWVLTLETEQEQQQLEPHLMHMHHTPTNYWLFARKSLSNGLFSWECAEDEFEPWRHTPAPPESRQGSHMRCAHVEFHRSDPAWADSPCDAKQSYICRKLVSDCQ